MMHILKWLLFACAAAMPVVAHADLAVHRTRIVHLGGEASTALRIWNQGKTASLVQAWIDSGERHASPEQLRLPFTVVPPLLKLQAGANRDLRVQLVDAATLPADRESVFWLNVLDVPGRAKAAGSLEFDYSVRWRLKLFHRPAGLPGSAEQAPGNLKWQLETLQDGRKRLHARNDSPYHVSLAEVKVGAEPLDMDPDQAIVRPYSAWSLDLPSGSGARHPDGVTYLWIDDQDERKEGTALLQSAPG